LLKNSKCSESLQIERERRPRRCEPNATRFVSNGRREREISRSVRIVKQKKKDADCAVRTGRDVAETVRPYADVACDDVAVFDWQMWSNCDVTRGIIFG
jgi:hypothetical protein